MATSCVKSLFCVFNLLYSAVAILFAGAGIYFVIHVLELIALRNYERHQLDIELPWPLLIPCVFVIICFFVLFTTCCGIFGAGSSSRGLIITYSIFLSLVIVLLLAVTALASTIAVKKSEDFVSKTIEEVFQEARINDNVKEQVAQLEVSLHCCGPDGSDYYLKQAAKIPASCCDGLDIDKCRMNGSPRKGCINVANHYVKLAFYAGSAGAAFIALLCVLTAILTVSLLRSFNSCKIVS